MAKMTASKRDRIGTRKVRALREEGRVPAIVYGHGQEPMPLSVSAHDLGVALLHGERVLNLNIDGKSEDVLIKDVQYDTFGQQILHADFTRVNLNESVTVAVPVVTRGTPAAEDGVLQQQGTEVSIECLVRNIPDEIRVSVNEMQVDDQILAGQLELPRGAKLVDDPEMLICSVTYVSEIEEEPVEEEVVGAEPEVIGEEAEGAEEGEGGEEGQGAAG